MRQEKPNGSPEVLFLLGLASLAGGLLWIYPPACLITLGVLAILVAIVGAR